MRAMVSVRYSGSWIRQIASTCDRLSSRSRMPCSKRTISPARVARRSFKAVMTAPPLVTHSIIVLSSKSSFGCLESSLLSRAPVVIPVATGALNQGADQKSLCVAHNSAPRTSVFRMRQEFEQPSFWAALFWTDPSAQMSQLKANPGDIRPNGISRAPPLS